MQSLEMKSLPMGKGQSWIAGNAERQQCVPACSSTDRCHWIHPAHPPDNAQTQPHQLIHHPRCFNNVINAFTCLQSSQLRCTINQSTEKHVPALPYDMIVSPTGRY